MGRSLDSSSVGDGGGCWALVVRVLEVAFNAFRILSCKQEFSILQVEFVAAWWIYSNGLSV